MISYRERLGEIRADQLSGFFVGWPNPPSAETHLRILQGSSDVVLAVDGATDLVVGFITAITDGVLSAYIPLLEVVPTFQGRGIGSELMRRMLARLDGLYMIDLLTDPDTRSFYSRQGMRPATGMMIRNFDRQAGA